MLDAQKNNTSITFFYGLNDSWCPIKYANEMIKRIKKFNNVFDNKTYHKIIIDKNGIFEHAFVIHNSNEMAIKLCTLFL